MVTTTIEHALGGISRRWELFKQFDGEKYVPSQRHDFKSAYFHAKQACSLPVDSNFFIAEKKYTENAFPDFEKD